MEAKVITCFNQKGGSGKTTTATQLADTFGRRGYTTAVADIDRQSTTSFLWGIQRAKDRVETVIAPMAQFGDRYLEELAALANNCDLIFIDCPPLLEDDLCWKSLVVANLILIPVPPSMGDVISSLQAGEFAAQARKQNPTLKISYFVSQYRRGMYHNSAVEKLRAKATDPVLQTMITQRAVFAETQERHCGLQWLDPNAKTPAMAELNALADEVSSILTIPKTKKKGKGTR